MAELQRYNAAKCTSRLAKAHARDAQSPMLSHIDNVQHTLGVEGPTATVPAAVLDRGQLPRHAAQVLRVQHLWQGADGMWAACPCLLDWVWRLRLDVSPQSNTPLSFPPAPEG